MKNYLTLVEFITYSFETVARLRVRLEGGMVEPKATKNLDLNMLNPAHTGTYPEIFRRGFFKFFVWKKFRTENFLEYFLKNPSRLKNF